MFLRDYLNDINQCEKSHPLWVAPFPMCGILIYKSGESQLSIGVHALISSLFFASCLV